MGKIEWVPLSVPVEQRVETLMAAIWALIFLFGPFICPLFFCGCLILGNNFIRILCLAYLTFVYFDRDTPYKGGRGQGYNFVRSAVFWKYLKNYFPCQLIKTADLPPDRNYLFATYPHGCLSLGVFCNFATNASNWKLLFPGIRSKSITIDINFFIPIYRELLLSWGMIPSSSESIKSVLTASNNLNHPKNSDGYTSNAAILILGGAHEALYSRPNNYQIILKKRKGFVKIAIETGSPIVPILSFGEVDLFDQIPNPPGSLLRRFQEWFKNNFGFAPVFLFGRGFFQYNYGLIPRRKPVTTVVGAPIEVKQCKNPSEDQINNIHAKFSQDLYNLFEEHKKKYIKDAENVFLKIE